jgi:hypothetical protein
MRVTLRAGDAGASAEQFAALARREAERGAAVMEMDPHERATSCWYRIAGLASQDLNALAIEILEAEIRSAQHDVCLQVARLVLTGEPTEIARQLRERAERTIRPK